MSWREHLAAMARAVRIAVDGRHVGEDILRAEEAEDRQREQRAAALAAARARVMAMQRLDLQEALLGTLLATVQDWRSSADREQALDRAPQRPSRPITPRKRLRYPQRP